MISLYNMYGSPSSTNRWLYGRQCSLNTRVLCETQTVISNGETGIHSLALQISVVSSQLFPMGIIRTVSMEEVVRYF